MGGMTNNIGDVMNNEEKIKELEKTIEELSGSLAFYANEAHWDGNKFLLRDHGDLEDSPCFFDYYKCGYVARITLAEQNLLEHI